MDLMSIAGTAPITNAAIPTLRLRRTSQVPDPDPSRKRPSRVGGISISNFDFNTKLCKAIQQKKFKIPTQPKKNVAEKVPTGVKDPGPKKTINPIPAEGRCGTVQNLYVNNFQQSAEGESGHHWWHHFWPGLV